jgi:hypothetical protein
MNKKNINNDGVVLFNEECGICNFEINHYKKKSNLKFENCSQLGDKYLKQLHIKFPDKSELVGVDAFIYVWSRTKGFQFLSKIIKKPIVYTISKGVYKVIASLLFYRFKIKKYLIS